MEKNEQKQHRLEGWIAFLIAMVSLTAALAAWRTANLGSRAGDLIYQGLLDAVKQQALANENWRETYQEAGYARDYLMTLDAVAAEENSADPAAQAHAALMHTYLLPGMLSLAGPLGSDPAYLTPQGGLDVQKRFAELDSEPSNSGSLDPQASFSLADSYFSEQRWLVVGTILIAISLFWLGLSQLSHLRSRLLVFILGILVYVLGLAWAIGVEVIFAILRAGAA